MFERIKVIFKRKKKSEVKRVVIKGNKPSFDRPDDALCCVLMEDYYGSKEMPFGNESAKGIDTFLKKPTDKF